MCSEGFAYSEKIKIMDTITGNKLIAAFDGWEYYYDPTKRGRCKWWAKTGLSWDGEHPPSFNEEWELLMPVVEKIGSMPICFNVNINSSDGCCIYGDNYKSTSKDKIFKGGINGTLIYSTWAAVVKFIQHYNKTKISNNG